MKYILLTNPIISINNYEMPNESCAAIGFLVSKIPDHDLYHKYNFFMKDLYHSIYLYYSIFGLAEEVPTKVLDEMKNIVYYKPRCRPPYSKEVLRFTLLQQRNTSKESYHFFSIIAIVFFA